MGREADPTIKARLTERILEYLLEHGVQDLSLRPLAKAVGSNARMLIYHFGSKEQLIIEALELAQTFQLAALSKSPNPKPDPIAELSFLWQWFSSSEFLAFAKLLFELEILAIKGDPHYEAFAQQIIEGWIGFVQSRFTACDRVTASIIVNAFSGFLLDLLISKNTERVNTAFKAFAVLISKEFVA